MGVKVREVEGVWRLVVDWKGRRVSRNVGPGKEGRRAARTAAAQIQAKLVQGDLSVLDPAEPAPAPVLVRDIAQDWLASHQAVRGIRHNTWVNYDTALRNHVLPLFGARPVQDFDVAAVEAFIAAKLQPGGSTKFPGRPLSRGTLRVSLNVLRVLSAWAINRKLLDTNPVAAIRFTRTSADDPPVDPFTTAELQAILGAAQARDPELAALIRVWMATGMRAGEVSGLQWHDLDLDAGTVLVRRTFSRGRLGPTKTGGPRLVSLGHPIGIDTSAWRPGSHPETRAVVDGLRRLPVGEARAVSMPLRAGQMSLHDGMLLHGSHPNRSRRRRCGLAVRFTTPDVRQVAPNSLRGYYRPVLVRGIDRHGHFPPVGVLAPVTGR